MMPKQSFLMELLNTGFFNKLKKLKNGNTVEMSEKYEFGCQSQGINIKVAITGNKEDMRRNFSNYKFLLNETTNKTYFQLDMNSKISQGVLDKFVKKDEKKDEDPEDPLEDE